MKDLNKISQSPSAPSQHKRSRFPLAFNQQSLWFLSQVQDVSRLYHICFGLQLKGALDRNALLKALDTIVERHEILRTIFVTVDGLPWQDALPHAHFHLAENDLGQSGNSEEALQTLTNLEAQTPFNLKGGILIRGRLVRVSTNQHVLIVTTHHLISDAWSIDLFIQELRALYSAFCEGSSNPLPTLSSQYRDYAIWQRQLNESGSLELQSAYWKKRLTGTTFQLDLPIDRPKTAVPDTSANFCEFVSDEELTLGLKALSRRHRMTLFMTLLAGWSVVLAQFCQQDDVTVGVPVTNRRSAELQSLIGFFVNTLPLRLDFYPELRVSDLLAQAKQRVIEMLHHQDLSFERVVELVNPPRVPSQHPIFQVMVVWQNSRTSNLGASGLTIQRLPPQKSSAAKFALSLYLQDDITSISGGIEYAAGLFERRTIQRLLACFASVLRAMVTDDKQFVRQIAALSTPERERVLYEFNQTDIEYPDLCVHELFEEQVRKHGDALAIVFNSERMSYRELNRRANQLAHYIRAVGVRPDHRVGICLSRRINMVIAMLAVLKAGGSYVPLDPAYPTDRLRFMVEDSEPIAILTESHLTTRLTRLECKSPLIAVDSSDSRWETHPDTNLAVTTLGLESKHLAYVIYTSGSTGKPKGVAIEHQQAVNFIYWAKSTFSSDDLARVLFSTSLSFDLSVFECFVPLAAGGTVVLTSDMLELKRSEYDITLINTVPSAMKAIVETHGIPRNVKVINLAGEPLKTDLVESIFATCCASKVCNLYAPSETTTYSTWTTFERAGPFAIHIGRPISNTRVYILNEHLQPVPIGVKGEIYIGGAGVARGYHNRADLTAARFLVDPFWGDQRARMYRTGDVGRWRFDGNIELMGRNDFQVKIRGFRIELGEIEARLREYAPVQDAAVIVRDDVGDDARLIAYYTQTDEARFVSSDELRAHMSTTLPEYMLPSTYVHLERLPVMPNGKLDRNGLPLPDVSEVCLDRYEAPQGELEAKLAAVWEELLKLNRVGRNANFFSLGGHSLLALRAIVKINRFAPKATTSDLFFSPTIAGLAERIAKAGRDPNHRHVASLIRSGQDSPTLFLSHCGSGELLYAHALAPFIDHNVTIYGLPAVPLHQDQPTTIPEMAAPMVSMIREVQPSGPYYVAGWCIGGVLAYEVARQLAILGEETAFVGLIDSICQTGTNSDSRPRATDVDLNMDFLVWVYPEAHLNDENLSRLDMLRSLAAEIGFTELVDLTAEFSLQPERFRGMSSREIQHWLFRARTIINADRSYVADYISAPVHLFSTGEPSAPSWLGWDSIIPRSQITVHKIPGSHVTLMKDPHVQILAGEISSAIVRTPILQKMRRQDHGF